MMEASDILNGLQKKELVIVNMDVFRQMMSGQRADIRKKICSTSDALEILDVSINKLYALEEDPQCMLRRSSLKGKWVLESVYDEADRLNGK